MSQRMKMIYVAGPFRAATPWEVEQNIRRAEELVFKLNQYFYLHNMNFFAICPHTMFRYFDGTLSDQFWLDAVMEVLRRSDAVVAMKGHATSSGTLKELALIKRLGKPIFFEANGDVCYELRHHQWDVDATP